MAIDISSTVILNINAVDYCCFIIGTSKCEAINPLRDLNLNEKSGS